MRIRILLLLFFGLVVSSYAASLNDLLKFVEEIEIGCFKSQKKNALKVATKMIKLVLKQDWEAYAQILSKKSIQSEIQENNSKLSEQEYRKKEIPSMMRSDRGKYNKLIGYKLLNTTVISETEVLFTYHFTYQVKHGTYSENEKVWVVFEEGKWKIQFFGTRPCATENCYNGICCQFE
jgi:hypothetical protein